jgi:hypothetical protein
MFQLIYNKDDETKKARNKENKMLYYVNNLEKIKGREKLRYEKTNYDRRPKTTTSRIPKTISTQEY